MGCLFSKKIHYDDKESPSSSSSSSTLQYIEPIKTKEQKRIDNTKKYLRKNILKTYICFINIYTDYK